MASAGVSAHVGKALNVRAAPKTFTEHLQKNAINAFVDSDLRMGIYGQKLGDALKQAAVSTALNTASGIAAQHIGAAYGGGSLNLFTHKIAHGALAGAAAATTASLLGNDPRKAALSAGLSAMVAETIAEFLSKDIETQARNMVRDADARGESLTPDTLRAAVIQRLTNYGEWGKIGAAVTALLLKHDVHVAIDAATNAIENNHAQIIKMMLPRLSWSQLINVARGTAGIASLFSATELAHYCNEYGPELTFLKLVDDGTIEVIKDPTGKLSYWVGDEIFLNPEDA